MPKIGTGRYRKTQSGSFAADIMVEGFRHRKRFKTKDEAIDWLEAQDTLRAARSDLTPANTIDAIEAIRLANGRVTLVAAVKCALDTLLTIEEIDPFRALEIYLDDCAERKLSQASLTDYRVYIKKFLEAVDAPLPTITHQRITEFIRSTYHSDASRNAVRRKLHAFFEFAVAHRWVEANPCRNVPVARRVSETPKAFDVETVRAFMRHLEAHHPEFVPYFALAFWTGARPHELQRVAAAQIASTEMILYAHQTKTRVERYVPIPPNLRAWLDRYPPGKVLVKSAHELRRDFRLAREAVGLAWIQDGTRHTFASMHVGAFQNAALTAAILGHRNQDLLFRHYRGAVTKAEAVKYWEIGPG